MGHVRNRAAPEHVDVDNQYIDISALRNCAALEHVLASKVASKIKDRKAFVTDCWWLRARGQSSTDSEQCYIKDTP
jgi:hypothetical protein